MTFRKPSNEFENKDYVKHWYKSIGQESSFFNHKIKLLESSDNSSNKYAPKYPKKFTLKDLY